MLFLESWGPWVVSLLHFAFQSLFMFVLYIIFRVFSVLSERDKETYAYSVFPEVEIWLTKFYFQPRSIRTYPTSLLQTSSISRWATLSVKRERKKNFKQNIRLKFLSDQDWFFKTRSRLPDNSELPESYRTEQISLIKWAQYWAGKR